MNPLERGMWTVAKLSYSWGRTEKGRNEKDQEDTGKSRNQSAAV